MSVSSQRHLSPEDPLYYAPRSVISEHPRSNSIPQTISERSPLPTPSPSEFDEMFREARRQSRRYPLEPEVVYDELVYESDGLRPVLGAATRLAAAMGVLATLGLLFFFLLPRSQGSNPPSSAGATRVTSQRAPLPPPEETAKLTSEGSQTLLQKFEQFGKSEDNPEHAVSELQPAGTAKATSEASATLLGKFVQWKQRQ